MANFKATFKTQSTITMELTERQFLALEAMSGYDHNKVVDILMRDLGKAYLGPYAQDMVQLLKDVKEESFHVRTKLENVRKAVNGEA